LDLYCLGQHGSHTTRLLEILQNSVLYVPLVLGIYFSLHAKKIIVLVQLSSVCSYCSISHPVPLCFGQQALLDQQPFFF